jgi:hypothetical protein
MPLRVTDPRSFGFGQHARKEALIFSDAKESNRWIESTDFEPFENSTKFLPLPWGVGRGEGEGSTIQNPIFSKPFTRNPLKRHCFLPINRKSACQQKF